MQNWSWTVSSSSTPPHRLVVQVTSIPNRYQTRTNCRDSQPHHIQGQNLPAWTHVTSLYTRLHIANIDQRYFLKSLITAFKCITHAAPTLLAERFSINTRPSNSTRQTTTRTFKLPNVARQIGLHSPSFLFADRFNGLQADLRSCQDLPSFVNSCKLLIGYPRQEG